MNSIENLTYEEVLELIENFPIKPLRNKVIVTMNSFIEEDSISMGDGVDEVQYVLAVGPTARDISAGDKVLLDLQQMTKMVIDEETGEKTPMISIRPVKVYDRYFAMLSDSYLDAIDNR